MDYEEKIRNLYNKVRFSSLLEDSYVAEKMEEAFPELKEENVDEMIRKELIWGFKHLSEETFAGISINDVISWLEKQGQTFTKKDVDDAYLKGICDAKHELKKQGEQKPAVEMKTPEKSLGIDSETYNEIVDECIYGKQVPADKVEPKFKVKYAGSEYNVFETKDIAGVTFYGIEDEPNHIDYVKAENCEIISGYGIKENGSPYPTKPAKFSEQNHAWSEEDENMIDNIIDYMKPMPIFFESTKGKSGKEYTQEFVKNAINWLKSIKDRVQTKTELIQLDENILEATIAFVEQNNHFDYWRGVNKHTVLSALHSLRPHNRWKPSDEQMSAFKMVFDWYNNNFPKFKALESLYNDLNKLK